MSRSRVAAAIVFAACALAFVTGRAVATRGRGGGAGGARFAAFAQDAGRADFSKFRHESQRHASLACSACHQRAADNSAVPRLPGHKACSDCHLPQFVSANTPFCFVCHAGLEGRNPPVKNFPPLRSFNARFDHAQHNSGAARPAAACAACHAPASRRAAAMTIPAGTGAHAVCYSCHKPGTQSAGRDIGSCGSCHAPSARYARTPVVRRAFAVTFSHADHGARQRLACADCHALRAGAPQSAQVAAPRLAQHFAQERGLSCRSCHNDRRRPGVRAVFGDAHFRNCQLCHKRQTFSVGP